MLQMAFGRLQKCLGAFALILSCIIQSSFWAASPIDQPTPCHHSRSSLPLKFNLFIGIPWRPCHVTVFALTQTFSHLTNRFFAESSPVGKGTIGKVRHEIPWFCHFEWLLLSICVCSILMLRDKRSYYYKNDDSGQSRATFILFLARLGAEICRNSRLQFAC